MTVPVQEGNGWAKNDLINKHKNQYEDVGLQGVTARNRELAYVTAGLADGSEVHGPGGREGKGLGWDSTGQLCYPLMGWPLSLCLFGIILTTRRALSEDMFKSKSTGGPPWWSSG